MHLQMTFTAPDGTVYPDGFVKLTNIICAQDIATMCLNFYPDADAYARGDVPADQRGVSRPTDDLTVPLFNEAYLYLLTLPEFAGAVLVNDQA